MELNRSLLVASTKILWRGSLLEVGVGAWNKRVRDWGETGEYLYSECQSRVKNPAQRHAGCPRLASCCRGILASITGAPCRCAALHLPLQPTSSPPSCSPREGGSPAGIVPQFPSACSSAEQSGEQSWEVGLEPWGGEKILCRASAFLCRFCVPAGPQRQGCSCSSFCPHFVSFPEGKSLHYPLSGLTRVS